ncbi:MAG: hydrogenase expression protein [Synergistaceae bacterium]|jgi:hydrogenase maturation factor|nr:hydrogenase expression protein [Synergistaceae bacterium]
MNEEKLPEGKLSPLSLKKNILTYTGALKPELLVGPAVGEDAAVIKWPEGKYLVFSSDPIVGASIGAGKLLVRINSNDIASKGADPEYLVVTLILPPSMGEEGAAQIMREIHNECLLQNIAIAGGHTEFNSEYDRPVISAAMIGTADRVLRASDIQTGDLVIITKHIAIEGMSIIATDRPDLLSSFMSEEEIEKMRSWSDEISVLNESKAVRKVAKFMHDPTEGGFMGGVKEISLLCGLEVLIDQNSLPIDPLTRRASEKLKFNPLNLIASGSLIVVVAKKDLPEAQKSLRDSGIEFTVVGTIGEKIKSEMPEFEEELWRLLKMEKIDEQ